MLHTTFAAPKNTYLMGGTSPHSRAAGQGVPPGMSAEKLPWRRMGERTLNIAFAEPKNSELAATGQSLQPTRVYVGGLPEGATDAKLQAFFAEYGEVHARAILQKSSMGSQMFGDRVTGWLQAREAGVPLPSSAAVSRKELQCMEGWVHSTHRPACGAVQGSRGLEGKAA